MGLIPARGGSKGVPRKNIRPLAGKPLITYTIRAALKSKNITRLIVSTDDDEIAGISRMAGAETPFRRPTEISNDVTSDQAVYKHALDWLHQSDNYAAEIVVVLRPTTPFKTPETIDKVIDKLIGSNADIVRTMTPVDGVDHPYWMYRLDDLSQARPFVGNLNLNNYYQRQLLPPIYRINGLVDAITASAIQEGKIFDNKKLLGFATTEEESVDIDNELDFQFCEHLLKQGIVSI